MGRDVPRGSDRSLAVLGGIDGGIRPAVALMLESAACRGSSSAIKNLDVALQLDLRYA
jgi:hypothetical protein